MKVQATNKLLKIEYLKHIFKKGIDYNATAHFCGFYTIQFYTVQNVAFTVEDFKMYFKEIIW